MRVRVLYFEDCPHREPAVAIVRGAARELGVSIDLEQVRVHAGSDLAGLRFLGSPTVQVDGVDIEPAARLRTDFAFGCRVYGPMLGVPPRDLVVAALSGEAT